MKLKNIHADVWLGAILIIVAVWFYTLTGSFINPDAAVWPRIALIATMILSAMLLLRGIAETRKGEESPLGKLEELKGPMAAIVLIVIYAVIMNLFGFFVSTALFLPVAMFAMGSRNWKAIVGVTAGLELFVYVLFVVELKLRMP